MNKIEHFDIGRVIARTFKLDKTSDPIGSISSELVPVMIVSDFRQPHPADTEVNRGAYDGLFATVAAGDVACTFELFNPAGSGIFAEVCSVQGGATYAADVSLHISTAVNPHAGGTGIGKLLHLGTQGITSSGNTSLSDGFDLNRLATLNFGGGFISIGRANNSTVELCCPGIPLFVIPGSGLRVMVKGGTAGSAYWRAAWIERRQIQVP